MYIEYKSKITEKFIFAPKILVIPGVTVYFQKKLYRFLSMKESGTIHFNDPAVFTNLLDYPKDYCKKTGKTYKGTGTEISIPEDFPESLEIKGSIDGIDFCISIYDYFEDELKNSNTCKATVEFQKKDDSDLDKTEKIEFVKKLSKQFNAAIGFYLYDGFYAIENHLEDENYSVYNNGEFESFYSSPTEYENGTERVFQKQEVIDVLIPYQTRLETLNKILNIKKEK